MNICAENDLGDSSDDDGGENRRQLNEDLIDPAIESMSKDES